MLCLLRPQVIAYTQAFLFFDGFKVIESETVRNVLVAGAAVFVICVITLGSVQAGIAVTAMVACVDVCVFGELMPLTWEMVQMVAGCILHALPRGLCGRVPNAWILVTTFTGYTDIFSSTSSLKLVVRPFIN